MLFVLFLQLCVLKMVKSNHCFFRVYLNGKRKTKVRFNTYCFIFSSLFPPSNMLQLRFLLDEPCVKGVYYIQSVIIIYWSRSIYIFRVTMGNRCARLCGSLVRKCKKSSQHSSADRARASRCSSHIPPYFASYIESDAIK